MKKTRAAKARKEETAVTALQSQQQALEALALQQKSQSLEQSEFHSQLSEVVALTWERTGDIYEWKGFDLGKL